MTNSNILANQKQFLGHPVGLYILFLTEMWERFSYYGMRAILVLYLVGEVGIENAGLGWSNEDALALYGWYTMFVYVASIPGGIIADKILGQKKSVFVGGMLLVAGHSVLAIEAMWAFYTGLTLIVMGVGMLKPNISTMVGGLYPKEEQNRRDIGFYIFYMGINAGAFLGILLCGYIGESVGWHYGFGLAGIFMFFGMLQFYFAQKIFARIGLSPRQTQDFDDAVEDSLEETKEVIEEIAHQAEKSKVTRDRLIVIGVLAFFTIFFWWAFEQAGGSMTIFAADYTDRVLVGNGALTFKIFNTILTVVPMLIITWVLTMLFKQTFGKYALSNILLGTSFVIIWAIVMFSGSVDSL